ncbi:DNA repair protein RecN (Recombination protein N) [Quadrisphaera granulorum]|uniref:DNA repair protein RecN n=1 Tax=Quadrisphaera granulorum TaxID=317664 RepID=A0A315ZWL4_9ACTN|nr:DNA repair protein RecN [Quadrisphaera granulorum]PWJ49258.1 DNA repair protein RecN (Recombination protein N) [Quadrisphaera granulorum]SZE98175.1 DNA repair protein RecN (Recombination protein N) [Quadrisphaera granulorum]
MLEEVRLRNLGVITDATLELSGGFTVITGETGAGKTMLVTGLGLLLGARADAGAVRRGADSALVEGRFVVTPGSRAAERAAEAGAELDDDVLIVARSVSASGRGRAHAGGRSVPVAVLSELADDLVAVHGQSEQVLLRSPARQRLALDRFAGAAVAEPLERYTAAWRRLGVLDAELAEITATARERAAEAELLRAGLGQVEAVAPQPGEDRALAVEADRLDHAEELRAAAALAHAALTGDPLADDAPDAASLIEAARRPLEAVREHDPDLGSLADQLAEVGYLVADAAAELASAAEAVEVDPVRLAAVQERRAALAALVRALPVSVPDRSARANDDDESAPTGVDAVLAWAEQASPRLLELDGDGDRTADLRAERAELVGQLLQLASELTAARTEAAQRLGELATAELPELAMPHAQLLVQVSPSPASAGDREGLPGLGASGADDVALLLRPSPGQVERPLAKGASGGELSRVMLALELVLAASDVVPTFVFDEVDAGVGGKAAVGIGRRLARLARDRQVVVVTHLPQVAAWADQHLRVAKAVDGQVTVSGVTALDGEERVVELARMLAGQEDSGSARAHAEELLVAAAKER